MLSCDLCHMNLPHLEEYLTSYTLRSLSLCLRLLTIHQVVNHLAVYTKPYYWNRDGGFEFCSTIHLFQRFETTTSFALRSTRSDVLFYFR